MSSLSSLAHANLQVYVSPSKHQSAEETWSTITHPYTLYTENFNSLSSTANWLGSSSYTSDSIHATYTANSSAPSKIVSGDQYGGFNEGNYLGLPARASVSIQFDTSFYTEGLSYFGFFFSAGDPYNSIDIFSGEELLMSFSTKSLLDMLPRNSTITAINGTPYQTNSYYGQATTGTNSNEAYAYLHFVANAGISFDRVVLHQGAGSNGQVFENDNHSVLVAIPEIPDTWATVPVPEPSGVLLVMGSSLYFLFGRRRK